MNFNYENLKNFSLSLKLKKLRWLNGLSQVKLAEKAGCSRGAISKWERGLCLPKGVMLEKIRVFYNLPLDFFINDEEAIC